MEGSRRTWLDPDSEGGWKEKYISFSGRVGRGAYAKRGLVVITLTMLVFGLTILAGLEFARFYSWDIPTWLILVWATAGPIILVSSFSLGVRRLHDMGRSGGIILLMMLLAFILGFVAASIKSGLLLLLVGIVTAAFQLSLYLWPGTKGVNKYGVPQKNRVENDENETSWQQLKREIFSTSGRISRKWFVSMMLFFMVFVIVYKLEGTSQESVLVAVLVNLVIRIAGIIISMILIRRRLQDIGWNSYLALIPTVIAVACLFPNLVFQRASTYGLVLGSWWIIFMLLSIFPGERGHNEHGRNPVEADLLPGEVSD
jgi:Predicted membrane protein